MNVTPQNSNQLIFGISGCDKIVSKNGIWHLLEQKFGRKNASIIMPETFILNKPEDIKILRKKFNNNTYILKKNIQRKKGLKITNNLDEILKAHEYGFKVAQLFKKNTFMIDNTKMNLRVYVLIICQYGNVKIYIHKLGKCLYASKKYRNNMDFDANITDSYKMDNNAYQNKPESFEELRAYLDKNGYNSNLLFKRIDLIVQKIGLASENNLCQLEKLKNNKTFQLFGVDFIFDNNMYPTLLELNKGPDMIAKNNKDSEKRELHERLESINEQLNGLKELNNISNNLSDNQISVNEILNLVKHPILKTKKINQNTSEFSEESNLKKDSFIAKGDLSRSEVYNKLMELRLQIKKELSPIYSGFRKEHNLLDEPLAKVILAEKLITINDLKSNSTFKMKIKINKKSKKEPVNKNGNEDYMEMQIKKYWPDAQLILEEYFKK